MLSGFRPPCRRSIVSNGNPLALTLATTCPAATLPPVFALFGFQGTFPPGRPLGPWPIGCFPLDDAILTQGVSLVNTIFAFFGCFPSVLRFAQIARIVFVQLVQSAFSGLFVGACAVARLQACHGMPARITSDNMATPARIQPAPVSGPIMARYPARFPRSD